MTEPLYPLLSLARLRMGTDGAGVTTLIASQGCPLHCRWCINERLLREAPAEHVTAAELIERVRIDDLYFRATGGGVTFGGGEPLHHAAYIRRFRALCPPQWRIWAETSLAVTDWNDEWKRLQRIRRKMDDAQYWNTRSKSFGTKDSPSPYVAQFLELAGVQPGETVLDMGCGTGSLAVPLAHAGAQVIAADFSQGLLDELAMRMSETGVGGIEARLLAWADDWEAAGLTQGCVDVAIASRSISTFDMTEALDKLTNVARRRCCIALPTGCSPRMDPRVLKLCGVENNHGADHQYAWNILQNKGLFPTCSYIDSVRKDTFGSIEEACEDMGRMVDETLDPSRTDEIREAKERLRAWLEEELVANEEVGQDDGKGYPQKALRLKHPRIVRWAFIAWDK